MQMSNEEIVAKFNRSDDKKAQIGILADLNGCDKEKIKQILIEGGVSDAELPKERGRKLKEPKYKPSACVSAENKGAATKKRESETIGPVMDYEKIPGTITGGEADIDEHEPVLHTYRPIEEILETEPRDEREAERVERYRLIPEPVKELCMAEKDRIVAEILKLEKRHDQIADYLNGEAAC